MTPYYYVYKYGDKAPRVRHSTLHDATQEAERLAKENPGSYFEILQCLGFSRTTEASTFWVDGAGPAGSKDPSYRYYRDRNYSNQYYRVSVECGTVEGATTINPEWEATTYKPTRGWVSISENELPKLIEP
jgi:hypothetical protein